MFLIDFLSFSFHFQWVASIFNITPVIFNVFPAILLYLIEKINHLKINRARLRKLPRKEHLKINRKVHARQPRKIPAQGTLNKRC